MTEQELLIAALQDSQTRDAAFAHLVKNYKQRLYWHIRRLVLDHDDADDVLQETFIKIFKNIENFRGDSQIFTWMYRIATHQAIDFLNKQARRKRLDNGSLLEDKIELLESDVYFDGDAAALKLQKALAKLPEKQRLVFNMKYFDNLKFKEIARILDCSEGGLKATYHHAVKKIKLFLDEK